ncbi:kinase-like protein, partial [Ramicandelaber brevisporus]
MPAQSPIQPFSINTVILDSESGQEYQLMRLLGSGSYALVYLARELSTGNQYAIKCLSKLYLTPEQMELQRQEAVIHAKAGPHPYIVRMHRSFDHDDWLFLLIEYVDGTDLYDWITERPIPSESAFANQAVANKRARETAELFKQILDAVAWIHARGIFHRDLKPENFMCSSSGSNVSIKLTDFGLATMETLTDDFECGSAPYMAAENRHPYWPTYSPAANDIWSLGIILINMTYGVQLWQDPHPSDSNFAKFLED